MTVQWTLLEPEEDERERFADLEAVTAHDAVAAGPRNRLREVRELRDGDRRWFLKVFHATQPKNRLRFLLTAPASGSDGEREARVTQALRGSGVDAPRPVAWGRDGGVSYYLCAGLPGRSLREILEQGSPDWRTGYRAAAFCGGLLARGFRLPDLSAEHVWVLPEGRFAVLDLHNGAVRSPGAVPDRLLSRVLRHFARSVRGLGVGRGHALRFAAHLLRAAGAGSRSRRILRTVPPLDPAARYETGERVRRYRDRNPERTSRELRLLARVWPGRVGERVLDCPCGVGRLWPLLRDELGAELVAADGAFAMVAAADAERFSIPRVQADALYLPFGSRAFDGAVLFRFLHHLPPAQARAAVREAARVAGRFVVITFFHPVSLHGWRRRLGEWTTGHARTRYTLWPHRLRGWMTAEGFSLHAMAAQSRWRREFWVAAFSRSG